jgi:F-type H+-transporting ATPase subunit delta
MKVTVSLLSRAFVDTVRMLPVEEHARLADAAASLLQFHGLLHDSHKFVSLVEQMWQKQEGIVPVSVTTVSGTLGSQLKQLLSAIESSLKRSCVPDEHADPSILGGVRILVEDERFDCTLRSTLNDLASRIAAPIPLPS